MMPEMDGFALLAALRKNPATRALPVIMLSARAGEEARIEGIDAGVDTAFVRDRIKARGGDEAEVENIYRLQIMNTSEFPRRFLITASGLHELKIEGEGDAVEVAAASSRMIPVRLEASREHARKGANPIVFTIRTVGEAREIVVTEKASFVVP